MGACGGAPLCLKKLTEYRLVVDQSYKQAFNSKTLTIVVATFGFHPWSEYCHESPARTQLSF